MMLHMYTILLFIPWLLEVVRCDKTDSKAGWNSDMNNPANDDIYVTHTTKWLLDKIKQKHKEKNYSNKHGKKEVFVKDINTDSKSRSQENVVDQDELEQELTQDVKKKEKNIQSASTDSINETDKNNSNEIQSGENRRDQESEKVNNIEETNYTITSSEETKNIKKLLNVADLSLGDDKMFIKELKTILKNERNKKPPQSSEQVSYEVTTYKSNRFKSINKSKKSTKRDHTKKNESATTYKKISINDQITNQIKNSLHENILDQVSLQKQAMQNKDNGHNYEMLIQKIKNNLTPLIKELIQQERKAKVTSSTDKLPVIKSSNIRERVEEVGFQRKNFALPMSTKNSGNTFIKSQTNEEVKRVSFTAIDDTKKKNRFEKVPQNSVNEVPENSYRLYNPNVNNMQQLYQNQYLSNADEIPTVTYEEQTQNYNSDTVISQIEENPNEQNNIGVILPSIVLTEDTEYITTTTEGFVTSKSYGVIHNFFGKIKKKLKKKIDKILGR